MNEHTEQTKVEPDAVPARIQLEDFIEAVAHGVARALAAQEDVSGHALPLGTTLGPLIPGGTPILIGIIYTPPSPTDGRPGRLPRILTERPQ